MAQEGIIVLGASGFVGARLVARLHKRGAAVHAVDRVPPAQRLPGVEYTHHDVRTPLPAAWGRDCGLLYNFAAMHRTPGHPDNEYYDTNIAGALNATALAEQNDIRTLVFTSSISVYGPSEDTLTEASALVPVSSYGRSKRLAEIIHERWAAAAPGRRLITVRPGVIFGPGEGGNYTQLARAMRGGYFFYPGRRDTIKSGGYVDELLDTFDFALARPEPAILYNYAYPDMSTTEEIVRTFADVAGYAPERLTLPLPVLMAGAHAIGVVNALGFRSWIHPERVMKLVRSTRVAPGWLMANHYAFKTNLRSALELWRDETAGRFD